MMCTGRSNAKGGQPAQGLFLLLLVCSMPVHGYRQSMSQVAVHVKRGNSTAAETRALTAGSDSQQFLCLGLCIGALIVGPLVGLGIIGGSVAYTVKVTLFNDGDNLQSLLSAAKDYRGFAEIAAQAAEIAAHESTSDLLRDMANHQELLPHLAGMSTEEVLEHAKAVVHVSGVSEEILQHMAETCGRSVMPKGLGASGSSSRSGAIFFNCATPGRRGAMLQKGDKVQAFRDSTIKHFTAGGIGVVDRFGRGVHNDDARVKIVWEETGKWTTHPLLSWWEDFKSLSDTVVDSDQKLPRVLLKAGIRDSEASPEWSTFTTMAGSIGERYEDATLLNKMVSGFTAFDQHWLAMQDADAEPLVDRLKAELGIVIPDFEWGRFDIKPMGSRAPQLPEGFETVAGIAKVMGPINEFIGWDRMTSALTKDLEYLKGQGVIDESLFVQTAGPFHMDPSSYNLTSQQEFMVELFGATPMCAFQQKGTSMAIVCVTVLDYVLSLSLLKHAQNALQGLRWNNYGDKVLQMMHCIGDMFSPGCHGYTSAALGHWQALVAEQYDHMPPGAKAQAVLLEAQWNCCCNTTETANIFTMETMCAWIKRDKGRSSSKCAKGLEAVNLRAGGCLDLEPVELEDVPSTPAGRPSEPATPSTRSSTRTMISDVQAQPLGVWPDIAPDVEPSPTRPDLVLDP